MACPAPPGSRKGNRITADRWSDIFVDLGHEVSFVSDDATLAQIDVLVALHARKSYPTIARYRKVRPTGPLVVALTGTDLYRDIRTSKRAQRSLELADRLVTLQPRGRDELGRQLQSKVRSIIQSAEPTGVRPRPGARPFDVFVLGHLRWEKDPFRTALALRMLDADTRIRVRQAGQALSEPMAVRARTLMAADARYRWLGEVSQARARRLLAASHLTVVTSRMEGGANVICEALADEVPILASDIPGNIGLLGPRYPGYFPLEGTAALAGMLNRAVTNPAFYARLKAACVKLKPLVDPEREARAWRDLLAELV
ncbi:MAG: TIGR04348 family glycosyltransferase [Gemmataceae bacterium]|nr:TIGR04348 family glycosyltransferase [Gemmataceae bacterium]